MGLDPPTLVSLSPILRDLDRKSSPKILLGLRPQDPIPYWITHLVYLSPDNQVIVSAGKLQALFSIYAWMRATQDGPDITFGEKEMARAMKDQYGSPPSKLPPVLHKFGTSEIDFCDSIWDISRADKDPTTGFVDPSKLDFHTRKHFNEVLRSSWHEQDSPQTRLYLTTSLSEGTLRAFGQAINNLGTLRRGERQEENASLNKLSSQEIQSEPLIELSSIIVKYGDKVVLGHGPPQPGFTEPGLNLTISRGTRMLLLGPNGSGKTTLLSLLTSDHPQSYSLPIKFFGRTRLPSPGKPGLSLWQIQSRIGHSSPEVHSFFPRSMTVRQVLESAWAETFSSKPSLTSERSALVDHFLRVWKTDLCHDPAVDKTSSDLSWATDKIRHPTFGRLPFGVQRLLLLLRAIIRQPDIIVLDEAFSGLPEDTRTKALNWLERGDHSITRTEDEQAANVIFPGLTDQQALIVVSHVREEIPNCINEYVRLPSEEEARDRGRTVQRASVKKGYMSSLKGWNRAWGL